MVGRGTAKTSTITLHCAAVDKHLQCIEMSYMQFYCELLLLLNMCAALKPTFAVQSFYALCLSGDILTS